MGASGSWEDLRRRAKRSLPRVVFDYVDGGADDEVTLRENRRAFSDLAFRPRVLAAVGERSQEVEVLGQRLRLPVILAPAGLARVAGAAGEVAAARSAAAAGTVSVLSAATSLPMERVAAAAAEPQWFQLFLYRDPALTERRIREVRERGFRVLVVTADAPVAGNRERDRRNGLSIPLRVRPGTALSVALRPRWLLDYLTGPPLVQHYDGPAPGARVSRLRPGGTSLASVMHGVFNPNQGWDDLRRCREAWDGPLVLKGVMCAEDAARAVELGCDGVVVSNHGGRQLDGLPAAVDVLPEVVEAVGSRADVLLDGGVRRGTDVVKALALGAKACLVGRPWVFGLATGGEAGVAHVLETFREEIDRTLALVGVRDAASLDRSVLRRRPGSGWERLDARP